MLPDQKRDIVLHAQIQNIPDGRDDQVVGILIMGAVEGIVERQQFLFLAEYRSDAQLPCAYLLSLYYKQSGIVNGCGGMNSEMNHEPVTVHRKPEDSGVKRCFLPFLCITKRVAGNGVNSNTNSFD